MAERRTCIAGRWTTTHAHAPNINPSDTRDVVDRFPMDEAAAVAAVSEAAPGWAAVPALARFEAPDRIGAAGPKARD